MDMKDEEFTRLSINRERGFGGEAPESDRGGQQNASAFASGGPAVPPKASLFDNPLFNLLGEAEVQIGQRGKGIRIKCQLWRTEGGVIVRPKGIEMDGDTEERRLVEECVLECWGELEEYVKAAHRRDAENAEEG
jgi:hypothetical protein